MPMIMKIRGWKAQSLRWICSLPVRLHRDEDGQMVLIAGVLILILAMTLVMPIHLSIAVRQKIQAQNAADAAAITGAIWQLRGLNVIQGLNDLVYLLDAIALVGLIGAAICGPLVGSPVAVVAIVAGNVALVTATGTHFAAQCVVSPLRDVAAHGWGVVCYVGASESARANDASRILGAGSHFFERLGGFTMRGYIGDQAADTIGGLLANSSPPNFIRRLVDAIVNAIPLYAIGAEMSLPAGNADLDALNENLSHITQGNLVLESPIKPMWLHVDRVKGDFGDIPLRVEDAMVDVLLALASPLFFYTVADTYFSNLCGPVQQGLDVVFGTINDLFKMEMPAAGENDRPRWDHAWYESSVEDGRTMTVLPTVTWMAAVRGAGWSMPAWDRLGGFGLPNMAQTNYEPLGALALASAKLTADPVRKVRFAGLNGNVLLVPVKITTEEHSLDFGICH